MPFTHTRKHTGITHTHIHAHSVVGKAFQMHLLTVWKIYDFLAAVTELCVALVFPPPPPLHLILLSAVHLHFAFVFAHTG